MIFYYAFVLIIENGMYWSWGVAKMLIICRNLFCCLI